jgi:nucleoside-diphosphate-sugar epimerase
MRILLSGGTGFVGGHVRSELVRRGWQVIALTRGAPEMRGADDDRIEWREVDLARPDVKIPVSERVDAVLSLAQSRHYRRFPEQAEDIFRVNVASTLALLEWARRQGTPRFVQASSANVYPRTHAPILETTPTHATSFYASSKRMAELLVESYAALLQSIVVRLFTIYGVGQADALVPSLFERIGSEQAVEIEGPRGLRLSPLHVRDAARGLVAALDLPAGRAGFAVYNLGGAQAVDIFELAERIGHALGQEPSFRFRGGPDPGGWVADASRAQAELGWKAEVSLDDGLAEIAAAGRPGRGA